MVVFSQSQESNGSSCVIGYGGPSSGAAAATAAAGGGQQQGQQQELLSPWLVGIGGVGGEEELTSMTLSMDQDKCNRSCNAATNVGTGNGTTVGTSTTSNGRVTASLKGNECSSSSSGDNKNNNASIENSRQDDNDDEDYEEELILKGRRKRNRIDIDIGIRKNNYELQQDYENGQGGTFADLEKYLIDNHNNNHNHNHNHTQQLSHDHIDASPAAPVPVPVPVPASTDTFHHCHSNHRQQHYQQQPLSTLESPTATCTNNDSTDIDTCTGIHVDTTANNTITTTTPRYTDTDTDTDPNPNAGRYGHTYNNSQHGITPHQMVHHSTRNQTQTHGTTANHYKNNNNKPQSIHVLKIIQKQQQKQQQQQLLNQGNKLTSTCTPSQQHSRTLYHTSRNSSSNSNTVFQDEFASRLIRNNSNTVKRKTSASALKSTSIQANDDLFSTRTSGQQPMRTLTSHKDTHSHFAKRTIANDDIGLSSSYRGRQTSMSIQGSSNKTPRRILGASASASPKRRSNANAKSTTPVRVLTQSQKLAAATQSSTMLLRTGTRTRTRMSMSMPMPISRSNMNRNSVSATSTQQSFPNTNANTFDCLSAKKTLTSWPKWDTSITTCSQDGIHGGHGNVPGQECNDDDLEPSFGPSFLSNKKRKIPRMDNVADEEDGDGDDTDMNMNMNIDHNGGGTDNDNGGGTTRSRRQINEPFGTPRRTVNNGNGNNNNNNSNNIFTDGAFRSSPQPVTPKKSARKSKKNKGPFSRMLHSTRTSIEADHARFHSGNYPYRHPDKRRHDVNDPRNRAETIMDVTVTSHPAPIGSGESASIVGYVHQHVKNDAKIQTMRMPGRSRRFRHVASELRSDDADADAGIDTNDDNDDSSHIMESEGYALVCFTRDLFVDLGIEVGSQIRIYNAQIINREVIASGSEEIQGRPVVVCTNLCEVYPSELPPLSVPG